MNFRLLLDEAINRGEKIKQEVLAEILKSKTIQEIVSNKNFIKALTKIIETKQEIKHVLDRQTKSILSLMEVPSRKEITDLFRQMIKVEGLVKNVTRQPLKAKTHRQPPIVKPVKKGTKRKKTTHRQGLKRPSKGRR